MNSNTETARTQRPSTSLRRVTTWGLRIALGAFFIMSGSSKLIGTPDMLALFDDISLGHWLRYVTGGIETVAAVMLLVPRLSALGAAALAAVLAGATLTHLLILGQGALLPLALLAVVGLLLRLERRRTVALPTPRIRTRERPAPSRRA